MNKGRIQIRTKSETNRIHIQGIGDVGINRDYGFATKLRAPDNVVDWIGKQEPVLKSAATDGIYYIKADPVYTDDSWKILIHGEPALNTPYGALIGLNDSPNSKMVIDFVTQNNMTGMMMEEE
tara:strand:- start:1055 stop:1423 length:369 start_codon:yes stop_codon:yes gene_type:complete